LRQGRDAARRGRAGEGRSLEALPRPAGDPARPRGAARGRARCAARRAAADRLFADEYTGDNGLDWLLDRLEGDQADWLAGLPFSAVLDDTLYVHAAPDDDRTIVTELTTDEKLASLLSDVEQSRVVAGHTHMQLERLVGDKVFVNAGSVGWPYEGRPGAYWAILDDGVELRHTEYDLERAAELVRRSGHPRAEEVAVENILVSAPRAEALAVFGG
ncbi:MAG TPA: metallophosphoesterase family protein, partial [Gaiellaceae bacterium]|nr:metallophosphoesterase family protein [Gaiellaceae bacterium]